MRKEYRSWKEWLWEKFGLVPVPVRLDDMNYDEPRR